jgi:hypothetical protein
MKANEAQLVASNQHRSVGFGQPLRRFQRNLAAAQQHDIATPECHALRRQGGFELLPWRAVIVRKFSAFEADHVDEHGTRDDRRQIVHAVPARKPDEILSGQIVANRLPRGNSAGRSCASPIRVQCMTFILLVVNDVAEDPVC